MLDVRKPIGMHPASVIISNTQRMIFKGFRLSIETAMTGAYSESALRGAASRMP